VEEPLSPRRPENKEKIRFSKFLKKGQKERKTLQIE